MRFFNKERRTNPSRKVYRFFLVSSIHESSKDGTERPQSHRDRNWYSYYERHMAEKKVTGEQKK